MQCLGLWDVYPQAAYAHGSQVSIPIERFSNLTANAQLVFHGVERNHRREPAAERFRLERLVRAAWRRKDCPVRTAGFVARSRRRIVSKYNSMTHVILSGMSKDPYASHTMLTTL